MSQEPTLFNTSILDNIANSCPGATLEQVVAAATAANAHGFISKLPSGCARRAGLARLGMLGLACV